MKSGLYDLRKGHKNRIFILVDNSLLPALPGVVSRLLKSKIRIRFLCPFLRSNKPDFISKHLYQLGLMQLLIISYNTFEETKYVLYDNLVNTITHVQLSI